ncbi:MAG: glycosyltransferase family 2 protein [Rhodobacteraceae bacterium]|nr:glycosyltransferase family 2 protein [Paracoccaceae bacterium]
MSRLLTVILNYQTPAMTLKSAEAAMREMAGLDAELVIVDNRSDDGSVEAIRDALDRADWAKTRPVRLIESEVNAGFGAGNNIGILAGLSDGGTPDYVYILNSDAFPDAGSIRHLLDHLDAHPEAGFAGSYIHGPDGDAHVTAFRFPSLWSELEGAARFGPISRLLRSKVVPLGVPEATQPVAWLAGASMMMRRSVLEQIGLFDETFFLYFEETDLCLRAARAGHETHYVRNSQVTHIGSASTGMKTWKQVPDYWFDSRWHYFCKNHGRAYACAATTMHVAGGLLWRMRRAIQKKPRAEAPGFLRKLFWHDATAVFRPLPEKSAAVKSASHRAATDPSAEELV